MIALIVAVINIVSFLAGQYLVTRRNGMGFVIWAGSNLMVVVLNLMAGSPATACMFMVYCLANMCSVAVWLREKTEDRLNPRGANLAAGYPEQSPLAKASQRALTSAATCRSSRRR